MDERAHDGERAASGPGYGAGPAAEAEVRKIRSEAIAPRPSVEPPTLLLPRAAGGGAGAVAALIVPTADVTTPLPELDWRVSRLPPALATVPAEADPLPAEPTPAPPEESQPSTRSVPQAIVQAPQTAPRPDPAPGPVPVEPALSEEHPPVAPDVLEQIARELPFQPPPVEDGASRPGTPSPHAPVDEPPAIGGTPASEVAAAPPPHVESTLIELIPEVLPAPPKLPALSSSMAPALRPLQLEHLPPLPPPEGLRSEAAVPHAQPPAVPPTITPPPSTPLPAPELLRPSLPGPPPSADQTPASEESHAVSLSPPVATAAPDAVALWGDAADVAPESPSRYVPLPLPSRAPPRVERRYLRLALRGALAASIAAACLLFALLVLYRWVDPPASTLMLGQRLTGTAVTQRWVPLERISPNLAAAVISSEDGHFCRHHGVDWGELKEAIESAGDGTARGGSTISMQVVKNLFLWPSRSYIRKAIEIPLAYAMEALWPKRRILEIYLNIAEWGPGIFGAEAAARYHFRKSALSLNPREAALLAVSLPNPYDRQAGRPGPGTVRLADNLLLRMRAAQPSTACLRARADR